MNVGWPNWIGVVADDIERQTSFYRDVLGLRQLSDAEDYAQFDLGWPVMLEVLKRDPRRPQYDAKRFQIGFSTDDVHATFQRLVDRGVEVVTEPEGGPDSDGWWAYFRDVEGNVFEISQRIGRPWSDGSDRALVAAPNWTGIIARDFESTTKWVGETFGFPSLNRSDWWAWFDCGWPDLFEVIKHDRERAQYAQPGWQVAFGVDDIATARKALVGRGATALNEIAGGPELAGYWCDFHDAEGNVFAISQRLGPSWPSA